MTLEEVPTSFDFSDLKTKEIPVKLPDGHFLLVEADEGTALAYKTIREKSFRLDDGKVSGINGLAQGDLVLLAGCLVKCTADGRKMLKGNGQPCPVGIEYVKTMLHRISKPLVETAKKISELEDDDDTIDSLNVQIKKLVERRDKMVKEKAENEAGSPDSPKDDTNDTTESSD